MPESEAAAAGRACLDVKLDKTMDWIMMREECLEGYQNADHTTWSPLTVGHYREYPKWLNGIKCESIFVIQIMNGTVPLPFNS